MTGPELGDYATESHQVPILQEAAESREPSGVDGAVTGASMEKDCQSSGREKEPLK